MWQSTPGVEYLSGLAYLQPGRTVSRPGTDELGCAGVLEVDEHGRRESDPLIEGGQNGVVLNQYEVMQRRGIGDDQHERPSRRWASQSFSRSSSVYRSGTPWSLRNAWTSNRVS